MSRSIAILGAGESGIGAAILGMKQGYSVFLSDAGSIGVDRKQMLGTYGVDFEEGGHSVERILAVDEIVKSPGIPDQAPVVRDALSKGIPVISEIEFASRYLGPAKVVAITGTNGKTTTTLLTHHLLKTAGYKVALGGNVGVSFARLVAEGGYDYYVVEVSSFQLDGIITFKPDVAVLLNITPDHLDRYEYDFTKYVDSKFRITKNLGHEQCFIYGADSVPVNEELAQREVSADKLGVSVVSKYTQAYFEDEHLVFDYTCQGRVEHCKIPTSALPLIGKHNMINTMASVLSALVMQVPEGQILQGLSTFRNAPHRMELCGEVDGVLFINDSKATNVDSVYYALDGIDQPIIWIAGGIDKGNDYSQLLDLVSKKVKGLICMGTDNSRLTSYFTPILNTVKETDKLTEAVVLARELASSGDVVLLSPACASFDLFKNYEDRGDQFKRAVQTLVKSNQTEV